MTDTKEDILKMAAPSSRLESLPRETEKLIGHGHKTQVTKKMWKRISTWLPWSYISIHGDTLTLTIKFGDVNTALKAFRYYTTGENPHPRRD